MLNKKKINFNQIIKNYNKANRTDIQKRTTAAFTVFNSILNKTTKKSIFLVVDDVEMF